MKLKKVLAATLAGTMVMASVVSVSAMTVTNAAWWDAWTPTYEIADGSTTTLTFYQTTAGDYVYSSLNAAFVNVATDGTTTPSADTIDGYAEYVVLRSDNYGWGTYYETTTYTGTDYLYVDDETDYNALLTGAVYNITITRSSTTISYDYVITESDGTVLNCGYDIVIADLADSDSAYVFFTGDAGVSFTDEEPTSTTTTTTTTTETTTSETTTDSTTGTGDAAPIAAVAVALLGSAAIAFASKKKMA